MMASIATTAVASLRVSLRSPRTLTALFMGLVATLLGTVPGWEACVRCWIVLSWLILAGVVAASLALVLAAAASADWAALRADGHQALNVVVLMLAMQPLSELSSWAQLARSRGVLVASAEASSRAGGPRLAIVADARGGLLYDPDGEIAKVTEARTSAWRDDPVVARLTGGCIDLRHLVGPYSDWIDDCDEF